MPISAVAVSRQDIAVSLPVPKRRMSRALFRLEMIVHSDVVICKNPAPHSGAFSSETIVGQALPSSESGRPRLINDR